MTSLYFAENKNGYFWRQFCQGKISSKQLFLEVLLIVVKTQGKQYLGLQPQLRTGTIWLSMAGPQVIPIANACKCLSNGIMRQAWEMPQHSQTPSFSPSFSPNFPNIHQSHPSKEQKQTRKPLPWTAPSLRDHVPQAGVPSSWEKRQWTTSFPASRNATKRNWRRVPLGRPRISLHDCRFNLPARVSDPSGGAEKNAGSRVVTLTVQSCEIALNRPCNCMRQILFQIMVYRKGGHEWVVNTTIFRRTATCPSRCELGESMCIVYLCVL